MYPNFSFFLLVAGLLIYSGQCCAQDSPRFHFGFEISPKWSSQIFDDKDQGEAQIKRNIEYATTFLFDITPALTIQSGVSYLNLNLVERDYNVLTGCDLKSTDNGLEFDTKNSWTQYSFNSAYIGVPVNLNYYFNALKAPNLYVKYGTQFLFNLNTDGKHELHECKSLAVMSLEDYDAFEVSPILVLSELGLGYQFEISSNLNGYIEPKMEYSLNKIFEEQDFLLAKDDTHNNSRLLNFELTIGVLLR